MVDPDLPSKIRTVIKEPHGAVNRLNTDRIPLCLPPNATSPSLYALGFSRYAEIYLGFEEAWQTQLATPPITPSQTSMPPDERIRTILRNIYIPELHRSNRVKADLNFLPNLPNTNISNTNTGQEFRAYINSRISDKPHLLVAYVWIMYSALFNGGRWIRGLLCDAGPKFWGLEEGQLHVWKEGRYPPPLSFWQVEGERGGDDGGVRDEFRMRVVEADEFLTEGERQEILDETLEIFKWCERITRELDRDVAEMYGLAESSDESSDSVDEKLSWSDWMDIGRRLLSYLTGWN
ncbi:heme oxygenase-like protein [Aspergillus sclerotioniger CBS 115572]|uniref:Heme oxygenase-like protein n=1 Tax=Aspergillus sclerotioniger CBS 115572 TaxID=1450535 RepID=A0A317V7T0_9EURO|nr:heme oxygenase-like protein [Aspergillus sclerotioniger CBS 115572]PWY69027.1 heme oxygenase-like protein [Aspergillus sclerotioniger CBS 115572]